MKKLLLIALMTFGAPASGDNFKLCQDFSADLFTTALSGAPWEVVEKVFSMYEGDIQPHPESIEEIGKSMLYIIHTSIGTALAQNTPVDEDLFREILKTTCSKTMVSMRFQ